MSEQKLVPVEPTEVMVVAGFRACRAIQINELVTMEDLRDFLRAGIAAAPVQPAPANLVDTRYQCRCCGQIMGGTDVYGVGWHKRDDKDCGPVDLRQPQPAPAEPSAYRKEQDRLAAATVASIKAQPDPAEVAGLVERLNLYLRQLAPHIQEREAAQLIYAAATTLAAQAAQIAALKDGLDMATQGRYSQLMLDLAHGVATYTSRGLEICGLKGDLISMKQEKERAEAQIAALRKNDERYRWLRDENRIDGKAMVHICPPNRSWGAFETPKSWELDAAIDAALQEHKRGETL